MRTAIALASALVLLGAVSAFAQEPGGLLDCTSAYEVSCGTTHYGGVSSGNNASDYCSQVVYTGGEIVYSVELPGPNAWDLTATIDYASDPTSAVFILRECDENACLAWGFSTATTEGLLPGTYYVVVDCISLPAGNFVELSMSCTELGAFCCPFAVDCTVFDFSAGSNDVVLVDCGAGPNPWAWGTDGGIPQTACDGATVTDVLGTTLGAPYPESVGGIAAVGPVTIDDGCSCLELCHYYDLRALEAGGNVKISTDDGATWNLVAPSRGYDDLVYNPFQAGECIDNEMAFTGHSVTFVRDCFNLSAYIGQEVWIGLFFGTGNYAADDLGWYVSSIRIGGAGSPVENASWGVIKSIYR